MTNSIFYTMPYFSLNSNLKWIHKNFSLLFSLVPPKSLTIRDGKNNTVSGIVGPYEEGATVNLICEAVGGKPPWNLHEDERSLALSEDCLSIHIINPSQKASVELCNGKIRTKKIVIFDNLFVFVVLRYFSHAL